MGRQDRLCRMSKKHAGLEFHFQVRIHCSTSRGPHTDASTCVPPCCRNTAPSAPGTATREKVVWRTSSARRPSRRRPEGWGLHRVGQRLRGGSGVNCVIEKLPQQTENQKRFMVFVLAIDGVLMRASKLAYGPVRSTNSRREKLENMATRCYAQVFKQYSQ